ncbi:unnamed protein product [Prunus armeniaca]|uniref:Alpha/beta hydrolase fold-3 domain-containing protein n=1 Tax=Prunus armeniaca TaxID=36596 RepID=A0A6J5VB44_PRUAR|nr:unnamed protein product [Prunus armeniaca]
MQKTPNNSTPPPPSSSSSSSSSLISSPLLFPPFLTILTSPPHHHNTSMSTSTTTPPNTLSYEECRGVLRVYSDGSIVRSPNPSFDVPVLDDGSVAWKDVFFDPTNHLQLRLYKPAATTRSPSLAQLPELLLPARFPAPVRRRFARLSPRSRAPPPSAIHDGAAALEWLRAQAEADEPDTWLTDVADFENVFVSGDSAGGNIAHNLAVQFGPGSAELGPVRVRGYLLLAPFFGGTVLSKSEAEGPKDAFLNWELIDRFWRLSIPTGENTDHPLVNPFGPFSRSLEPVALDPILVVVGGSDLLKDRAEDYAKRLKNWGKKVEYVEFEGEQHGFFTIHPNSQAAKDLMPILKRFITENSS